MSRLRQEGRAWIEQKEMDVLHPSAGGQPVQVLRDERAEQDGRHPGLGDAMGHRQPCVAKGWPADRLIAAELAGGVKEPVDVGGDALAPQKPCERSEHGRLPRTRGTRDNEQRHDYGSIKAPALRADGESVLRLHHNRAVT
jgi:hypothetical protein